MAPDDDDAGPPVTVYVKSSTNSPDEYHAESHLWVDQGILHLETVERESMFSDDSNDHLDWVQLPSQMVLRVEPREDGT